MYGKPKSKSGGYQLIRQCKSCGRTFELSFCRAHEKVCASKYSLPTELDAHSNSNNVPIITGFDAVELNYNKDPYRAHLERRSRITQGLYGFRTPLKTAIRHTVLDTVEEVHDKHKDSFVLSEMKRGMCSQRDEKEEKEPTHWIIELNGSFTQQGTTCC